MKSPGEKGVGALVAIFSLIVGLAMVAVLVSQNAQTAAVIKALTGGGSGLIKAAVSPVAGGQSGSGIG